MAILEPCPARPSLPILSRPSLLQRNVCHGFHLSSFTTRGTNTFLIQTGVDWQWKVPLNKGPRRREPTDNKTQLFWMLLFNVERFIAADNFLTLLICPAKLVRKSYNSILSDAQLKVYAWPYTSRIPIVIHFWNIQSQIKAKHIYEQTSIQIF